MEERRPRERELVLSPNEYAYVLDSTKGHINCYVGPNKTSLAQTDELVVLNPLTKRFDRVLEMCDAVQLFATAPAGWYLVLKNPARERAQPSSGISSASPELNIGRKVNVEGPASFALWPGQIATVIQGHHLRSNQYLLVRCYDAAAANSAAASAVSARAEKGSPEKGAVSDEPWVQGEKRIIRGVDASFYIPPTGVEVVMDENRHHIRDAVTLQRLDYCILVGEDGRKTFLRGEAVVFPLPSQRFASRDRRTKFRAIELSETVGIYVKVIAPYRGVDDASGEERDFVEGEELFLTGQNRLYFPREEHAIIRHGAEELHQAVAIPPGEGRYLLNRQTGAVDLCAGPTMLLPDPRREVVVRRVLADRECQLMYPRQTEILVYNRALRAGGGEAATTAALQSVLADMTPSQTNKASSAADEFERKNFRGPRTITLDTRLQGVVSLDIWTGFAVQLKQRSGERRVVQGPATVLLNYNETASALSLSTGTPKSPDRLLHTAYLQLNGNKVSDTVELVTRDLVRSHLAVRYRVSFEGENPERWFAVDNYVQLLCDHASSKLKARARKCSIHELRTSLTDLVRDCLLGEKPETGEERPGLRFAENAMRVYDVEVLDLEILDENVRDLLADAQRRSVQRSVSVADKEAALLNQRRAETVERDLMSERQETELLKLELSQLRAQHLHEAELSRQAQTTELLELNRARELRDAELNNLVQTRRLEEEAATQNLELKRLADLQALSLQKLEAEIAAAVQQASAFSPHLVSALHRLGDETLLSALSENFSELAAVEGRGVLETARKFLDFVPSSMVPQLRGGVLNDTPNGHSDDTKP